MFPFEEEDMREWTEYGFALRPGDFRRVRGMPSEAQPLVSASAWIRGAAPACVCAQPP